MRRAEERRRDRRGGRGAGRGEESTAKPEPGREDNRAGREEGSAVLNLVVPTPGVGVYRSTQPGRALGLWPGTGRSHHLQRDRTRVRLQLQQGFSIGSAAVRPRLLTFGAAGRPAESGCRRPRNTCSAYSCSREILQTGLQLYGESLCCSCRDTGCSLQLQQL